MLQGGDHRNRRLRALVEVDALGEQPVVSPAGLGSHICSPESLAPSNQAAADRIPSGQSARGSAAAARAQASARVATSMGCWSKAGLLSCGPRPPTGVGDRWPSVVS